MLMKNDKISVFVKQYVEEIPMYEQWGNFVVEYICDKLGLNSRKTNSILKMPVEPRIKDVDSIVAKAFYRKKYEDPINQITDKVGIRFVVMVEEQIKLFQNVIESAEIWLWSKDVDYEDLKREHPEIFDYQSVHYVVRNKEEFCHNDVTLHKGIPCEIQIRTLEQHAYAELSHDYLYKTGKKVDYKIKRNLSKGMALNETTDELFSRAYELIRKESKNYDLLMEKINSIYRFKNCNEKLNRDIYENIEPMVIKYGINGDTIADFIEQYIIDNISDRQDILLFKQPVVLILYYLVKKHTREFRETWDLPGDTLNMIYLDLGISDEQ